MLIVTKVKESLPASSTKNIGHYCRGLNTTEFLHMTLRIIHMHIQEYLAFFSTPDAFFSATVGDTDWLDGKHPRLYCGVHWHKAQLNRKWLVSCILFVKEGKFHRRWPKQSPH